MPIDSQRDSRPFERPGRPPRDHAEAVAWYPSARCGFCSDGRTEAGTTTYGTCSVCGADRRACLRCWTSAEVAGGTACCTACQETRADEGRTYFIDDGCTPPHQIAAEPPVKVAGWIAECQGCGCITFVTWPRELPRDLSTLCHCPGVRWAAPLVYLEAGETWPAEYANRPVCEQAQRLREAAPR